MEAFSTSFIQEEEAFLSTSSSTSESSSPVSSRLDEDNEEEVLSIAAPEFDEEEESSHILPFPPPSRFECLEMSASRPPPRPQTSLVGPRRGSVASRESSYSPPADRNGARAPQQHPQNNGTSIADMENSVLFRKLEAAVAKVATEQQDHERSLLLLAAGNPNSNSSSLSNLLNTLANVGSDYQLLRLQLVGEKEKRALVEAARRRIATSETASQTETLQLGPDGICPLCQRNSGRRAGSTAGGKRIAVQVFLPPMIPLSRGVPLRRMRSGGGLQQQQSITNANASQQRFLWPASGEVVDVVETLAEPPYPIHTPLLVQTIPVEVTSEEFCERPCVSTVTVQGPLPSDIKVLLEAPRKTTIAVESPKIAVPFVEPPRKTLDLPKSVVVKEEEDDTENSEESESTSDSESEVSDVEISRKLRRQLRRTQKTQEINAAIVQLALNQQKREEEAAAVAATGAPSEAVNTTTDGASSRVAEARQRAKKFIEQRKLSMQQHQQQQQQQQDQEAESYDESGSQVVSQLVASHLWVGGGGT